MPLYFRTPKIKVFTIDLPPIFLVSVFPYLVAIKVLLIPLTIFEIMG